MKKTLLIFAVAVMTTTLVLANNLTVQGNNQIIDADNYWAALKVLAEQQPEIDLNQSVNPESGRELSKTKKIPMDKLICKLYKKGDYPMCVYYYDNGDFFSLYFDSDRAKLGDFPDKNRPFSDLWRFSKRGVVYYGGFLYNRLKKYGNGKWIVEKKKFCIKQYRNGNQEYRSYDDAPNLYADIRAWFDNLTFEGVRLSTDGLKKYHIATNYSENRGYFLSSNDYIPPIPNHVMIDDKLYAWKEGELDKPIGQIYDNLAVLTNLIPKTAQKVTSFEKVIVNNRTYPKITFDNGDYFVGNDTLFDAKLHINEKSLLIIEDKGVFKGKNVNWKSYANSKGYKYENLARVVYADGRVFVGEIEALVYVESNGMRGERPVRTLTTLSAVELKHLNGIMMDAQGKEIGKNEDGHYIDLIAQKKYREAKEKEKRENLETRARLEQKYGKKWVDMICSVGVRAGMPWELVTIFYYSKLSIDHGSSQCYELYTSKIMNRAFYVGYVWVSNGVVTSWVPK